MSCTIKRIFGFIVIFLLAGCGSRGPKGMQMGPSEVGVVTIQPQRLVLTRELPGRTAASRYADIRPQVNGLILKRAFEEGTDVKAGDLLYQIDPAQYQAAYDQAKAAVDMAEANLPAARLREERFKKLVESKAVGQQDYDNALAARLQAEAQVHASKAALEAARLNLAYTPIKAPISGRIGRSSMTEGAMVTAYQPMALATIQQLDPIFIDVPQSTSELLTLQQRASRGKLIADQTGLDKVTVIREDGSVYPLEGTLEFRDITVNQTTGSVILRIVVPNPDGLLLPGMFVRAVVKEGVIEDAILVAQPGVSRNPKGDPYVWVVTDEGKADMRMITVERAVGDKWLVSAGLVAGDRVIVEGVQRLRPGAPVTPVEAEYQKDSSGAPEAGQNNLKGS
ncbi:MAG: efflux RND transporter periplasmic adaptor subunit [Candidatus Omnitrophota bacterium]